MYFFPFDPHQFDDSLLSKFMPQCHYQDSFYMSLSDEIAARVKLFCHRMKYIRTKIRLPMSVLANRVGVSPASITQLEQGRIRPNLDSVAKIATQLGISIDYFVLGKEHTPVYMEEIARKILALQYNPDVQMTIVEDEVRFDMKSFPQIVSLLKGYEENKRMVGDDSPLLKGWLENQLMGLPLTEETRSSENDKP